MEQNQSNHFEFAAKMLVYIFTALLPIFFIPWPVGVELGREITFSILIVLGAIAWLVSILKHGVLRYQHSPVLAAAFILFVVTAAGVVFSKTPWISAVLADPTAERFSTLILGLAFVLVTGGVLRSREEVATAVFILIFSGGAAALINVVQLLSGVPLYQYLLPFAQGSDFNVIGTQNGAALFYAALFVMGGGFWVLNSQENLRPFARYLLPAVLAVFLVNLLVIHHRISWVAVLGASIVLFGFLAKDRAAIQQKLKWRYWIVPALILVSLSLLFVRGPIFGRPNLPAEVSPSFSATLQIAGGTFKEGMKSILVGSGPGTFGLEWGRYKDPSINQTVFWGIRFGQGFSWASTLVVTIGILGVLSFLLFIVASVFTFAKTLVTSHEEEIVASGLFLGLISLTVAAFLYPANFSLALALFLVVGLLLVELGRTERTVRFETPWKVFVSSLAAIFFISLGVAGLYFETGRLRSAFAERAGMEALSHGGLDEAVSQFERAAGLESKNLRHYQTLVLARSEKIRSIVARAARGENVQQEFQQTVVAAVGNSQTAIALNPHDPSLWRMQGTLYELVIPFIQGSERLALSSFQKAAELEPQNPLPWVDMGRAGIAYSDHLGVLLSRAQGADRDNLVKAKEAALDEASRALVRAVELKPDFVAAHFLLAQAALRQGNIRSAIQAAENAKLSAPFDIGMAFQLGLLYYQNNELSRARAEFERALAIDSNYSNARYFLGLIYDRQGERPRAIEEFEKIGALNPDNEEVKRILSNLRAGKRALEGIAPPGEAPEKRKETPVNERGGSRQRR